ncbi:unnamed protein product [Kluyveromyces dobzhanskii CBS 2104]|uniref:WGS project CCBQ000000000 data, contig 00017 n=1 Tax=Kluyveromyces dobzhanskii CBS 2104 TaxID=1427455 RepID=A0A0A8L8V4_9SACH|nr:unnamed protein product [Kluyveromyces dobzhanskii CBS 2104]
MSSLSSEHVDSLRVIDLSSNNIGNRLNDSFADSTRAMFTSGVQEHSPTEVHSRLVNGSEETSSRDRLLLSPYEEELYRRSLKLSPVTSMAAPIPTVTLLGEDGEPTGVKAALPYMADFDQFQSEQEKNNRKRRQVQEQRNDSLLAMFTRWSTYSSKNLKQKINKQKPLKRTHSSVRRKDFSVQAEFSKYNKDKKFIFHRGFSQRQNSNTSLRRNQTKKFHFRKRSRFQNEQELMSYMRYINPSELDMTELVSADDIRMYLYSKNSLNNLIRVNPRLHQIRVPLKQFNDLLHRSSYISQEANVVKRSSISRKLSRRANHVRRSSTVPNNKRSFAERLNPDLYKAWNSYLKDAIAKRIELRVSCLLGEDMSSLASSVRQTNTVYSETKTPLSELGSQVNPIIIPDEHNDDVQKDDVHLKASRRQTQTTYNHSAISEPYADNDTDDSASRPLTSIFSIRHSLTSADQNRRSFFFPADNPGMLKIDEEHSVRSVTSRNTLA